MVTRTSIDPPPERRPRRSRTRTALSLGMAGLLAAGGVTALAGTAEAASTLGAARSRTRVIPSALPCQQTRTIGQEAVVAA
ncbi:hypothetical protein ACFY5C_38360 [Streptomyces sp. NPDC012935]|uniref:hypothetical protein n=1 Tax=Streptomyces sp. NPDC012935 TaxID=3364857 RepID=UPI00367B9778